METRDQWERWAQWGPKDGQGGLVQKGFAAFQVQRYVDAKCYFATLIQSCHNTGELDLTLKVIPYTSLICVIILQGEPGLNGPLGQTGPPGPIVRSLNYLNLFSYFNAKFNKTYFIQSRHY